MQVVFNNPHYVIESRLVMASRNRSVTTAVPGAPAKMQPRKGKDGFVADNVFAISGVVPDDVRAGVDSFETLDSKSFRRCLQIASRVASGDAIDGRLLTETGAPFPCFNLTHCGPLPHSFCYV